MSSTPTPLPTPAPAPTPAPLTLTSTPSDYNNAFLYATVVIVILLVIYVVWKYSSEDDAFVAGQTQENSNTSSDYNLDEAIRRLKEKQQSIIKNLTSQFR